MENSCLRIFPLKVKQGERFKKMFGSHVSIQMYKAKKNDIEGQLTFNSMALRLKQKHSSSELTSIHDEARDEQNMVKSKIESLDDKTGIEYRELMAELESLRDEEDRQAAAIEAVSSDYEEDMQVQNTTLETQLEAINADLEALEQIRQEAIEDNFGYFQ